MPNFTRDEEDCPCGTTLGFFAPCPIHPAEPEQVPGEVPTTCFDWCGGAMRYVNTETIAGRTMENYECVKCGCPMNRRIR